MADVDVWGPDKPFDGPWGENPGDWNLEGNGSPGINLLMSSIAVWSWMQQRPCSVAEAAAAFNVTAHIVRQVVDADDWMLRTGRDDPSADIIIHDGE